MAMAKRAAFNLQQVLDQSMHDNDTGDDDFDGEDAEWREINPGEISDLDDPEGFDYCSVEERKKMKSFSFT